MVKIKRITTGIKGLDKCIKGGIPEESVVLYTGEPGTGKTIMALQFLANNCKKTAKGIYITLEQGNHELFTQAEMFGWNLKQMTKTGVLDMFHFKSDGTLTNISDGKNFAIHDGFFNFIESHVRKNKTRFLVFDSVSDLIFNDKVAAHFENVSRSTANKDINHFVRTKIFQLIEKLKGIDNLTSIVLSSKDDNLTDYSRYSADGIIQAEHKPIGGEEPRALQVLKMRLTSIDSDIKPLKFTKNGLELG